MKGDIVHGLLNKLTGDLYNSEEFTDNRKYFERMARYKYDGYKQYSPGLRFIESLALWLNQFNDLNDRKVALDFVKDSLIYFSGPEMDLLVSSCFPDLIKPILINKIATLMDVPNQRVNAIVNSIEYKTLLRQSLFCGLSDGARIEIFRRTNTGIVSHEQVYQTYELSGKRAKKMQDELVSDLETIIKQKPSNEESRFKMLFLLDDFSASGTSYLKFDPTGGVLKGKINALYDSIVNKDEVKEIFDPENLQVHIVLYLCTEQARDNIMENFQKLKEVYKLSVVPELHIVHLIENSYKLTNQKIVEICQKDTYYDAEKLEDRHTGSVKLGFSQCALPVVLYHNTPNNSISILWAYENATFKGLFPRVPRHKEI